MLQDWCTERTADVQCFLREETPLVLVRSSNSRPKRGLVLWDPGGPGITLPGPETPMSLLVPGALLDFDVMFAVEPWVLEGPSSDCLAQAAGSAPDSSCDLSTMATDAAAVARSVHNISRSLGRPVEGMYLESFGAARLETLLGDSDLGARWVVMESPAPPRGTSVVALFSARSSSIENRIFGPCDGERCQAMKARFRRSWSSETGEAGTSGRELSLGLLALATDEESNREHVDAVSVDLRSGLIGTDNARMLRRLGRQFELRGPRLVRPQLFGIWADVCPAYSGWEQLQSRSEPLVKALAWLYRGCLVTGESSPTTKGRIGTPVLLLAGSSDYVVPRSFQRAWIERAGSVDVITFNGHLNTSRDVADRAERWIAAHG